MTPKQRYLVCKKRQFTCEDCGRRGRDAFDLQGRPSHRRWRYEGIEIHHLKRRRMGGSDEETNLLVVCPTCHDRYSAVELKQVHHTRRVTKGLPLFNPL